MHRAVGSGECEQVKYRIRRMLRAHRITDWKVHLRTSLLSARVGTSSRRVSYLRGRGFDSRLEGRSSCQDFHGVLLSLQANGCKPARCVTYRE